LPHPGFGENSSKPCDIGNPASVLRKEFPELDFELVVDGWNSKTGEWGPDEVSIAHRAIKMRKWLKERPENEIIVLTHGGIHRSLPCTQVVGFLLYLVQEVKGFDNGECRTYTFADCEEPVLIPYSHEDETDQINDTLE
jgi:hypothetical protein